MKNQLANKSILFFCTGFHGYYQYIKEELYNLGASNVTLELIPRFPESHRNLRYSKSYFFLYHLLRNPRYRTKWTESLMDKIKNVRYDILFCIGDVPFKGFFIDWIKEKNPDIQTYLFLWDRFSVVYVPKNIVRKFDYKFSFDRDECKKVEGLEYLPDFYLHTKSVDNVAMLYDVTVIATANGQRVKIAKALNNFCIQNGLKSFIYLLDPRGDKSNIDFVKQERLTAGQVDDIQNQSSAIFDFSYKGRQGLTLNAVAALAKGKKLITSNSRIKDEDFYDPQNIYVYDFDNPQFDIDFFKTLAKDLHMEYLRLDNWLKYILCR